MSVRTTNGRRKRGPYGGRRKRGPYGGRRQRGPYGRRRQRGPYHRRGPIYRAHAPAPFMGEGRVPPRGAIQ
jgi:hypothetical protein